MQKGIIDAIEPAIVLYCNCTVIGGFNCCFQTVQKIGNIELPLQNGKEEWMGPLYKWIAFYSDEVKDFLDRLADVEDEEGSKSFLVEIYLLSKTIEL